MKNTKIIVNTRSKSYPIYFGNGIINATSTLIRKNLPNVKKICIISDKNLPLVLLKKLKKSLKKYDLKIYRLSVSEKIKNFKVAYKLIENMLNDNFNRSDCIISFGGGILGDLSAFISSLTKRGVKFINIPTTLLAQVDAAIGGKTAVNLSHGKNLVGTFYQPKAIQIDIENLTSLPQRELVGGVAEVIKSAMIRSKTFFSFLKKNAADILKRDATLLDEIIYRTGKIKAEVVTVDEKESGLRAILNYGHTIGHGLETASRYRGFHHGEAVSIGMEAAAQMSWTMGFIKGDVVEKQREQMM